MKVAALLTDLLKGSKEDKKSGLFKFLNEDCIAFKGLKEVFIIILMLCHYNPIKLTHVETDISGFALAEILTQLQDDTGL